MLILYRFKPIKKSLKCNLFEYTTPLMNISQLKYHILILTFDFYMIYISLSGMLFVIEPCITCHGAKDNFSLFGVELKQTVVVSR